jgi:hypothetical protein
MCASSRLTAIRSDPQCETIAIRVLSQFVVRSKVDLEAIGDSRFVTNPPRPFLRPDREKWHNPAQAQLLNGHESPELISILPKLG